MFLAGHHVFFETENGRHVYRIVGVTKKHYYVQVPLFTYFGSTFARWSPVRKLTRTYIEKKCKLLPPKVAQRYVDIRKGDSTSKLFG